MKTALVITQPNQIAAANRTNAELLELRTDVYQHFSLQKLVEKCTKPVIVTIKNQDQQLLQQALDLKVQYVDLDYKNKKLLRYFKNHNIKTKLIISYHHFKITPSFQQLNRLVKQGVNKIAVMINQVEDNWMIAQLLQKYRGKITAIGMGQLGMMTRLHSAQRISYFGQAAPGQLLISQKKIKLYGIIGHPVQHSLSPRLHNTWFKQKNIMALYQRWDTQNIKIMMRVFYFFNLSGASVTMPYKQDVKKYLDKIDSVAKTIGAVNTIVRRGKTLVGYNTDWIGVKKMIQGRARGKRVLILGQGGAAQAAAYAMKQAGAKSVCMISVRDKMITTDFDVLINATPIRTKQFFNKKKLHNKIVIDCNYGTIPTKLLQVAKQQGCKIIDGMPMLVGQAKEQFWLWMEA